MVIRLILFSILSISAYSYANDSVISVNNKLYREIKSASLEILKRCPPSDCVVLGIGRSPTPFMIFLQRFSPDSFTLPLSGFKDHPSEISSKKLGKLYDHFDRYIDKGKISGKKILLIDYAMTGDSLFASYRSLKKYMVDRKISSSITPLAIGENSRYDSARMIDSANRYGVKNFEGVRVDNNLYKKLNGSDFESVAEFGRASEREWGKVKRNTTEYTIFKNDIYSKMDRDPALNGKTLEEIMTSKIRKALRFCLERINRSII